MSNLFSRLADRLAQAMFTPPVSQQKTTQEDEMDQDGETFRFIEEEDNGGKGGVDQSAAMGFDYLPGTTADAIGFNTEPEEEADAIGFNTQPEEVSPSIGNDAELDELGSAVGMEFQAGDDEKEGPDFDSSNDDDGDDDGE